MTQDKRIAALEARLAAAEGRIAALEARLQSQGWPVPVITPLPGSPMRPPPGWPWYEEHSSTGQLP